MSSISVRLRVMGAVILLAVLGVSVTAVAHHQTPVRSYSACLDTTTGAMSRVKLGSAPLSACPAGQGTIHLSGGDITNIVTAAGSGLTGGVNAGPVTLSLDFANLDGRYVNEADAARLNWRGTWSAATAYATGDAVASAGNSYVALTSSTNAPPATRPATWQLIAKKGAVGATGPTGPEGSVGLIWRGEWVEETLYYPREAVSYQGMAYIRNNEFTDGISFAYPDTSPGVWDVLAAAGEPGPAGPGLRMLSALFHGTDDDFPCQRADAVAVTATDNGDGTCTLAFPAGTVDGFSTHFVEGGTLEFSTSDVDGSSSMTVTPKAPHESFFVMVVSAGPLQPDAPGAPGTSGQSRTVGEP